MSTSEKRIILVKAMIDAPIEKVWNDWTAPESIVKWNQASDDWHTTRAENDLRVGGKFSVRMEAKDGSMGFDFEGIYTKVIFNQLIEYTIGDGREVKIVFSAVDHQTEIEESFEAENTHPMDAQQNGWQAILDNFKEFTEKNSKAK